MTEIRAPRPEDVPAVTQMMNLPGVREGTLRLPYTPESFARGRLLEPGPGVYPLIAARDGQPVGYGALMRRSGRQAHMAELVLFVHDDHWGQGIGTALLAALIDLADNWLGLLRLQLEVDPDNRGALHLYQKMGFETEGLVRGDTLTNGVLTDSVIMGRLRPAPTRKAEP